MGQLVINKIITFCPLYQEFYYIMYGWDCDICSQKPIFHYNRIHYNRSENVQFLMVVVQGIRVVFTIKGGS